MPGRMRDAFHEVRSLTRRVSLRLSRHPSPGGEGARDTFLALEFGHTLEAQIGGQISAGFVITGLYEDSGRDSSSNPLHHYTPMFVATRAMKPSPY
jgi:hypothetical protein